MTKCLKNSSYNPETMISWQVDTAPENIPGENPELPKKLKEFRLQTQGSH
jgi:hypothetical protein